MMATNRKRTPRSRQVQTLHPGAINWLYDKQEPLEKPWIDRHFMFEDDYKKLWADNRADVLEWWTREHPGTRPSKWWRFDAPEPLQDGENQAEYLQRHGLLEKDELRALRAKGVSL